MSISSPSVLNHFLKQNGLFLKKRFSQNFLVDGNIVRKIVETAEVQAGDLVIEIGPGAGALTEALLAKGCKVLAIEKDAHFASNLKRLGGNLVVFQDDFLRFPLKEHLHQKAKVVSNLPYHITSPILGKLLPLYPELISLTLMVQKEVGKRIAACPSSADYGSLAVACSFYADVSYCFTVPPTCFHPRPKVESGIVQLKLKKPPLTEDSAGFFQLVRAAFGKRRKMLRTSLQDLYEKEATMQILEEMALKATARPEELSLSELLLLFRRLQDRDNRATKARENEENEDLFS